MAMTDSARKAFTALQALGATVCEWGVDDGYPADTAFVLIWANDDTSEVFADNSGKHIREEFVDGRYINPLGYRQDVHEILAKYDLVTDWANAGQIVVYNSPDAPGFRHRAKAERREGQS